MDKLYFELVTPDRIVEKCHIEELIAPGVEGELGILCNHAPLLTALTMGELTYRHDNMYDYAMVEYGFLEVIDNNIIILAENAELGKNINLASALEEKKKAEEHLDYVRKKDSRLVEEAEIRLKRELLRVKVAERYR